tara:strand:- start:2344 stop:3156 length:813 start_codon:yes stop_codon:yes gene_type:complete
MYLILNEKRFEPYWLFIESCKNKHPKLYHKHHIIPKHLGGDDSADNLIRLGYEDHQQAHLILAQCFPADSVYKGKNLKAANFLNYWTSEKILSNGWETSEETKRKISNSNKGRTFTSLENFIKLYGESEGIVRYNECYKKGRNDVYSFIERYGEVEGILNYNIYREKISKKQKLYTKTQEHCNNISKAKKGKSIGPCSEETKQKISKGNKGKVMSDEHIAKTRRATPCTIDNIEFINLTEASKYYNISRTTVLNRIKDERFPNYKFSKKQ